MHKTIILDWFYGCNESGENGFCHTHDGSMYICRPACELLSKKKSLHHHYVITFSDERSSGYYRVRIAHKCVAWAKRTKFVLGTTQRVWIAALGLKTLKDMVGHFYIKVTPFE